MFYFVGYFFGIVGYKRRYKRVRYLCFLVIVLKSFIVRVFRKGGKERGKKKEDKKEEGEREGDFFRISVTF